MRLFHALLLGLAGALIAIGLILGFRTEDWMTPTGVIGVGVLAAALGAVMIAIERRPAA